MKPFHILVLGALVGLGGIHCVEASPGEDEASAQMPLSDVRDRIRADNESGRSETYSTNGHVNLATPSNEFFQDLGTNDRSCHSCHRAAEGWSIRPDVLAARFDATDGLDPIFRPIDGANSPTADVSTPAARRAAFSLLLQKGLIRVGLPIPRGAEFTLIAVDDPYGHAGAAELSLYRRPLPSTNLRFGPTIMWDGRETGAGQALLQDLASQANSATQGHAQRPTPLPGATLQSIVGFEIALFHAQSFDDDAKALHAAGGRGGPQHLASEVFDPLQNVRGFDLYDRWIGRGGGGVEDARAAVARGQAIFNDTGLGDCAGCHDTHNVGTNAHFVLFDIGVSASVRRTPDLPLYTLRNRSTGAVRRTTDPGRALVTGRWQDIDLFKVPSLRGLAARAPYFHNGSAATLDDVVDHYEEHFGFTLTAQEQADLVAFLRAL